MTPCVGEIRAFGGNFAPAGWQLCDGSLLPISQYETLYTLLGTTYGGNGTTTFGVPDLRGRLLLSQGTGQGLSPRVLGQTGGTEYVTLLTANMPGHTHAAQASTAPATAHTPTGCFLAAPVDTTTPGTNLVEYLPDTVPGFTLSPLDPATVSSIGGSQPHENRMPFVAITYIIALFGVYPSFN
jgi:microcystin-dependent protein